MRIIISLITVLILIFIVFAGVESLKLHYLFGVIFPYTALVLFVGGFIFRIIKWGRSPIPFRIPTTTGQMKSLPFIKRNPLEAPSNKIEVIGRMLLEVLFFRSLFRNTKMELIDKDKLSYSSDKWLWLAGLAFHWSFFFIILRHLRFFFEPVPSFVHMLEGVDAFFQIGVPILYVTDLVLLVSVSYLFIRRVIIPYMRYISLPADYFPLFLILGIGVSGVLMRYFTKVDIVGVKTLAVSLVSLNPTVPEGIGVLFYIHLFLISVLFAYFPFSKLMHMGGIFMSPTRNMANNSRVKRHVNPWNYPVELHTYEEYENDFKDQMKKGGIPVEKE